MLVLLCVVARDRSMVAVEWELSTFVAQVKDKIAEKKRYSSAADSLRLFVAKKDDGKWLLFNDPDLVLLSKQDAPEELRAKYLGDG